MNSIIDPNLVLHLPLYELEGDSIRSRDAYGHPCMVSGATYGPLGRTFDGSSNYIDCGNHNSFDITVALSLVVWMYITSSSGSKYDAGKNPDKYAIFFPFGSLEPASYMDGLVNKNHSSGVTLNLNMWYQIGFTYDKNGGSNNRMFYIDGLPTATQTTTGSIGTSTNSFLIGSYDSVPNNPFNGQIGMIFLYNRALSPIEVAGLYRETKWRYK